MTPIFIAFYTIGTLYEREAARLRASLDALGLPHEIVGVPSRGDWATNASQTAQFCRDMLAAHPCAPLVYVDADAVVRRFPSRLCDMAGVDIAAHWVNGDTFANGTVYFGGTTKAWLVANRYAELVDAYGGRHHNEQVLLEKAIIEIDPVVKRLPSAYCYIHDVDHKPLAEDEIVIEHLQASRESRTAGEPLDNRRRRIAEREQRRA